MLTSMDEIHGIVEPKLEKVTVKLGYMGKKRATLAQPLPCKEQKNARSGKGAGTKNALFDAVVAFHPLGRVPQNDLITFQLPHDRFLSGQTIQQHPAGGLAQLLCIVLYRRD